MGDRTRAGGTAFLDGDTNSHADANSHPNNHTAPNTGSHTDREAIRGADYDTVADAKSNPNPHDRGGPHADARSRGCAGRWR